MKLKIFIAILLVSVAAFIALSQIKQKPFAPAEDFPREAILYVQIADLPAFLKLWNESKFKEKYLESANFDEFANRHLGRKLASRWREFSDAAGFPLDHDALGSLTENQAAIALYDIGKLEFVFIAPVSDEKFEAAKLLLKKFDEETLEDGTIIYRANVEADRGRQKQELIFTNVKGRFVLATSEKLLAQTLKNINGEKAKNRLIDEPSFKILSEKFEPHAAAVWVNQTALNDDYYFKRYWLMSDVEKLKNIRAGVFDFEMRDGKIIERRKFLLDEAVKSSAINKTQAAQMLAFAPESIPFYKLQSADNQKIDIAVQETIFERQMASEATKNRKHYFSYYYDDYYKTPDYYYLSENYDQNINETDEDEIVERREISVDFSKFLQAARPQAVLTFSDAQILPAPLFVEFRRAAVFDLASPGSFKRDSFESAVAQSLSAQVMISAPNVKLNWETKSENGNLWREFRLPMLGWQVSYALSGNKLILTNNADFLREIFNSKNSAKAPEIDSPVSKLTVINLDQREKAFDQVFAELSKNKAAVDFFTGNITSLLDSISDAAKIEIKDNVSANFYEQEITMTLK